MKKNVLIIGGTGFGGLGLIEIILRHPELKIKQIVARKDIGKPINEIFPHLDGLCELNVNSAEEIDYNNLDIAFFSTPDQVGMNIIKGFFEKGIPVVDFSGDFRFQTVQQYQTYATNRGLNPEHKSPEVLEHCVYGLPEIFTDDIKKAKIVGNPGCFPVAMLLGILPAIKENIITSDVLVCDGKTGVSGAGRYSGDTNLYAQRYENINTYREGHHQHVVEVEHVINMNSNLQRKILFLPHVVPMCRGVSVSTYADVKGNIDNNTLLDIYTNYYRNCPFVKVTTDSTNTINVKGSNRCMIRPKIDEKTGKFYVTSVIDNLMKGQAGNAIQVANIMLGFPETYGLFTPGYYP